MSEPIEILLNPNKQLLRLNCGQCGDTKDIILDIDKVNLTPILKRNIEVAVESILNDFSSKVGTEEARSSRVVTDEILKEVLHRLNLNERINVTIQDPTDLATEDHPEYLLSPVELIL